MRIALYQPEIPHNTGTIIRLGACLGLPIDIIHPCGFTFADKYLKRSAMDYKDMAVVSHHNNWQAFTERYHQHRLVLCDPNGTCDYFDWQYLENDIFIFGQESSGFPAPIKGEVSYKITIPMREGNRSLNLAVSVAMVASEILRRQR